MPMKVWIIVISLSRLDGMIYLNVVATTGEISNYEDLLECSPLFYGSMKQVFGSKNYERNCKLC
jgi:hypothetical protein